MTGLFLRIGSFVPIPLSFLSSIPPNVTSVLSLGRNFFPHLLRGFETVASHVQELKQELKLGSINSSSHSCLAVRFSTIFSFRAVKIPNDLREECQVDVITIRHETR